MSLLTFAGAVGSFQRIQDFLNIEDRQDSRTVPQSLDRLLQVDLNSDKKKLSFSDSALTPVEDIPLSDAIVLQNASFGWESGKGPLLDSINMTIPKEKVSMIVGPVGW
jgi:ABC-type multidrug transport system fused ATPase/permease subunit